MSKLLMGLIGIGFGLWIISEVFAALERASDIL